MHETSASSDAALSVAQLQQQLADARLAAEQACIAADKLKLENKRLVRANACWETVSVHVETIGLAY